MTKNKLFILVALLLVMAGTLFGFTKFEPQVANASTILQDEAVKGTEELSEELSRCQGDGGVDIGNNILTFDA